VALLFTDLVQKNIVLDRSSGCIKLREDALREAFYADCTDGDATRAIARLVPEALALLTTPVHITDENFGRVPRTYIECLNDRAIPLDLQRSMHKATPCDAGSLTRSRTD
jgi:hypothetical protein